MNRSSWLVLSAALLGGLAVMWALSPRTPQAPAQVSRPATLSADALQGKRAYETHCARCHGAIGAGTEQGPPLAHRIYEPGHHADAAFHVAVRAGVRQHHWRFGNMPPQPEVSEAELRTIIRYVREVQRANGIGDGAHGS
ncbi:MAG: cytochrome c [Methylobacterium sp.]|uniref:c-type cytochrome n=1 Tax=Methylobacterium sp. TaxID=409 RepID=UPI0025F96E8E|nr:cytochrome c [Methylobacterium sp.]MBX9933550.1 cytochrome c [Methylobacterium sp.]